jgi:hypothetical protein
MHNLFILDAQGEYGVMVKFLRYIWKTHIAKTNATKNTNVLATSYKYMIVNSLALDTRETKKRVIPSQKILYMLKFLLSLDVHKTKPHQKLSIQQLGM